MPMQILFPDKDGNFSDQGTLQKELFKLLTGSWKADADKTQDRLKGARLTVCSIAYKIRKE